MSKTNLPFIPIQRTTNSDSFFKSFYLLIIFLKLYSFNRFQKARDLNVAYISVPIPFYRNFLFLSSQEIFFLSASHSKCTFLATEVCFGVQIFPMWKQFRVLWLAMCGDFGNSHQTVISSNSIVIFAFSFIPHNVRSRHTGQCE